LTEVVASGVVPSVRLLGDNPLHVPLRNHAEQVRAVRDMFHIPEPSAPSGGATSAAVTVAFILNQGKLCNRSAGIIYACLPTAMVVAHIESSRSPWAIHAACRQQRCNPVDA